MAVFRLSWRMVEYDASSDLAKNREHGCERLQEGRKREEKDWG